MRPARAVLAALALALPGLPAAAADPIDLEWTDLVPEDGGETMDRVRRLGIIEHGELSTPFDQDTGGRVTTDYNGKTVRIPGFVVPLDFAGEGVSTFLLVPYVGACIHVPPPPPNQIVYVTAETPYVVEGFFEPVTVTGEMSTMAVATELAEIGYVIEAERVEPYE